MPRVTSSIYLGIDPGASGGLAILNGSATEAVAMPATERDVWLWICSDSPATREYLPQFAVIEKVGGYVRGASGNVGSAMFRFGVSYGGLRMALVAAGIPFEEVPPRKWQKALGISPRRKDEARVQWKNRLKAKAQQLFPRECVTLATADALLIATYCMRKRTGTL